MYRYVDRAETIDYELLMGEWVWQLEGNMTRVILFALSFWRRE